MNLLVLSLLLLPASMTAQKTVEVVDTIDVEELADYSQSVTQYEFKDFDWVDICNNPKYAIVTKNGKKGIYDMMLNRNITEIEYRVLGYSRPGETVDSIQSSWFFAKRGCQQGIMCVFEHDNSIMSIWMDDPDEVYSLDECTTIDKKMMKRTKKMLESFIQQQQMKNAQVVILDAKSGRLKTWIALDADMEKENAGKLLAHSCTGSLTKPFHTVMSLEHEDLLLDSLYNGVSYRHGIKAFDNEVMHHAIQKGYLKKVAERKWKEMTETSNPATSPFIIAVGYNSLATGGKMIIPTMKADSVDVQEDVFTESCLANLREVLTVDRDESPQLAWLPTNTDWLAYATSENLYAEDDHKMSTALGKQVQFAGVFPAENPKYTICVVADKQSLDIEPAVFQDVVKPLAQWLLKR
jgi:hypothetical protein